VWSVIFKWVLDNGNRISLGNRILSFPKKHSIGLWTCWKIIYLLRLVLKLMTNLNGIYFRENIALSLRHDLLSLFWMSQEVINDLLSCLVKNWLPSHIVHHLEIVLLIVAYLYFPWLCTVYCYVSTDYYSAESRTSVIFSGVFFHSTV
jgi:hypothetical protein